MFDKKFELTKLLRAIASNDQEMQTALKTQTKQQLGEILMQVDASGVNPLIWALLAYDDTPSLFIKQEEHQRQFKPQRDLFIKLFLSLDNLDIQAQILKHVNKQVMIQYSPFHKTPHILAAVVVHAPEALERFLDLIQKFDVADQHTIWTQAHFLHQTPILTIAFCSNFGTLKQLLIRFTDLPSHTKARVLHQSYRWFLPNSYHMGYTNETVLSDFILDADKLKLLLDSIKPDEEQTILQDMLLNQERENTVLLETMLRRHFQSLCHLIERIRILQNAKIRKIVLEQTTGSSSNYRYINNYLGGYTSRLNVLMCLLWSFKHVEEPPSQEYKILLLNKLLEVIYLLDEAAKESIFNPKINFAGMNPLLIALRHCPEMVPTLLPEIMKLSLEIQQDIIANFTPNDWSELANSMNNDSINRSILVKFILSTNPTNPITANSAELFSCERLLPLYQAGDLTLRQTIQEVFAEQVRNVKTIGQNQVKNSLLALILIKNHNLSNSPVTSIDEEMSTLIEKAEIETITNLSHLLYHLYLYNVQKEIYPEWKKVIKLQLEELRTYTKYPETLMALAMIANKEDITADKNGLISELKKLLSLFSFHKPDPIAKAFFNATILTVDQDPREVEAFISRFNNDITQTLGIAVTPVVRRLDNDDTQTEFADFTGKPSM